MGGYGSTRWMWHTRKTTVEECRILPVFDLSREGIFTWNSRRQGTLTWTNEQTCEKVASMGFAVNTEVEPPWLRLHYSISTWQGEKIDCDYKVFLQTTRPNFGGLRWWFICPLSVNHQVCLRRVAKLYLPPGGRYYGCRYCYNLTYKSCQESDKRIAALKRLGPERILNGIKTGEVDLLLGYKTLLDWIG